MAFGDLRKKPNILSIVTTILMLAAVPSHAGVGPPHTLSVVTLNLWHDQGDWPKRLSLILAEMRRLRPDRKSTRLNSSHIQKSRMPSSA